MLTTSRLMTGHNFHCNLRKLHWGRADVASFCRIAGTAQNLFLSLFYRHTRDSIAAVLFWHRAIHSAVLTLSSTSLRCSARCTQRVLLITLPLLLALTKRSSLEPWLKMACHWLSVTCPETSFLCPVSCVVCHASLVLCHMCQQSNCMQTKPKIVCSYLLFFVLNNVTY